MRNRWLAAAGFFPLYVAVAYGSLQMATVHISASPIWPPAGLAIAAVAVLGWRLAPVVFLAAFTANAWASGHVSSSLLIAAGNTGEAVLGGVLLARIGRSELFESIGALSKFAGIATAASLVSATIGVSSLLLFGLAPWEAAAGIWSTWWLGNLGGILIVTPFLLALRTPTPIHFVALGLGAAGAALAFATTGVTLVALLVVLYWALRTDDEPYTTWAMLGVAIGAIGMTLANFGPFWAGDANQALLLLQVFMIVLSLSVLTVGAGHKLRISRAKPWTSAGAIALSLAPLFVATIFVGTTLHPALNELAVNRQETLEANIVGGWQDLVEEETQRLVALRAFLESDNTSQAEFRSFMETVDWSFGPGQSTAVGYAHLVRPEDAEAYQAGIRLDLELPIEVRDGYAIFPPSPSTAAPIHHVYPMDPSPQAIGYDLLTDPIRAQALVNAGTMGTAAASPPVEIVRPSGNDLGFMVAAPVMRGGEISGYAVSAMVLPNASATPTPDIEAAYSVVDVTDGARLLFGDAIDGTTIATLNAWGRAWDIRLASTNTAAYAESAASWFVMAAGGVLSIAIGSVVYAYDSTRNRANRLAEEMTVRVRRDEQRLAEIERLESMDEMRTQFLNMVAHELRTPLTPLKTQTHILKRKAIPGTERAVDILERGTRRLGVVVDDLLVAAKAEAGELTLQRRAVDLADVVRRAVEAHTSQAEELGTKIELDLWPAVAWVDEGRIDQIVDNLLTNALKFARGGTIWVRVSGTGLPTIEVKDDGKGIDPKVLPTLGQPFSQAPGTDGGTGLGLYICRNLAKLHGGTFRIESPGLGQGTTATVQLVGPPE